MKKIKTLTLLIAIIIISFITSCSTSNLSVGTVKVKHEQNRESSILQTPNAIAGKDIMPDIVIANIDSSSLSYKSKNNLPETKRSTPIAHFNAKDNKREKKMSQGKGLTYAKTHPPGTDNNDGNYSNEAAGSVIFGVLGILLCWTVVGGIVFGVIALILGNIATSHDNNTGKVGNVLGVLSIILSLIFIKLIIELFKSFNQGQ